MTVQYRAWPSLLYYHLIHSGKHDLREVAKKMMVNPDSLYKWAEGVNTFPPELAGPLYNATGEIEFLESLMKDTGMMVVPRPMANGAGKPVLNEVIDVVGAVGDMANHFNKAMADGKLDSREISRAEKLLNKVQREVEDVRQRIKQPR